MRMPSQITSTDTFTRKLPRKAGSRFSDYTPRQPSSRKYGFSPPSIPTASTSKCAVASQAHAEQDSGQDDEGNRPEQLAQEVQPQSRPGDFAQEHHGREIGHVLERQELQNAEP